MPDIISEIISRNEERARRLAAEIYEKSSLLFLGRGISIATAEEAALKLKEIAYNHAEAYSAGESKHGPIALVQNGFPVIFIVPTDNTRNRMIGNIMEMKARGAYGTKKRIRSRYASESCKISHCTLRTLYYQQVHDYYERL